MPKVAHLFTSLEGGGSENYLLQLISHSPAAWEHRVYYLKKEGIIAHRLRDRQISVEKVEGPFDLYRHLREWRPEVLHTCLYRAHQMGRLVGRWAGVPVIVSSQQAIDAWQKPWHRWVDQATLRFCDNVIVNSKAALALVRRRLGENRNRPSVVHIENGLDPVPPLPDRPALRAHMGLPADAIVGGSLMRLHAEKGADLIPAYAASVLALRPDLHLIVGGTGPLEAALKRQTQAEPYASRLHWMGWQEDVHAFLGAADFFWSLSREESFPQALLEASAQGLAWVAPKVGGIPELLEAGAVGLLFEAGRTAEAVQQTNFLIQSIETRTRQARSSVTLLRQHYSVERMAARTFDLFQSRIQGERTHA